MTINLFTIYRQCAASQLHFVYLTPYTHKTNKNIPLKNHLHFSLPS
ncbi:hypothetical protein VCRA2116O30_50252 [Vibrio crassostreae]|nr:hypothetical protein VCRA2113O20_20226 [Vibrio crassostreae]CAK2005267.1 hypothetical protein VCRA2110O113_330014 [Vibrio crassostreae]CAK2034870.1 hypothetical protein VCRA2113O120_380008 [Vibrio crassostreae]CAK2088836.1 hypothetical protein VCRA2113O119_420009 [Vibrio crassostreae]CAK2182997.1 hypothetical protein VCRA2116O30_50252 [Vibrio crassostreae]